MVSENERRLVAYDVTNGMTYIGTEVSKNAYKLKDYVVVKTADLCPTKDCSFKEQAVLARNAGKSCGSVKFPITGSVVATHELSSLEDEVESEE